MARVVIGIRVQTEPSQLHATLLALRAYTSEDVPVVLLPDGPDAQTARALAELPLPQLATATPLGAPACLNRLITCSDEPLVLLLESGALPSPAWLDWLLHAIDADPRNGIAGPSTNRGWNEQAAFPSSAAHSGALARAARQAVQRYSREVRTLAPLHSLGDFCYLVRREVADAIGGADERYGLGPCWEMDYNLRATRAGFQAVWACASFVHRLPATAAHQADESRLREANRHLYQDRFCGQRLRGERVEYAAHCTGEACADFAPAPLIQLRMELPPRPAPLEWTGEPLVSCIMPTYNRRAFIARAAACVLAQDHRNLELLVVDDGSDAVGDCLPGDPRVRYLRVEGKRTIGWKRNLACEQARGEIIVHFDDDDWYPRWRVRRQVEALRQAELCGSSSVYYLEGARAWRYQYAGPGQWLAGNTLAYRKQAWARQRFPDVQVGEDARFVRAIPEGKIVDLCDPSLCVATVHSGNVSPKAVGQAYWHAEDAARIRGLIDDAPLISCIMPTADRRSFVKLALQHFARQDWPARELIVVDDGRDPVEDLVRADPMVRYLRAPRRLTIGGKRNLACKEARGQVIVQWDDDDWYAPDRLRRQVEPILRGDADLTGLEMRYLLHLPSGQFWSADRDLHRRMFFGDVAGGTLAFRRALFELGLRYPDVNLAEDAAFIKQATQRGQRLLRLENPGSFVYVRHGKNTWRFDPGRFLNPRGWTRALPPPEFPAQMLDAYRVAL